MIRGIGCDISDLQRFAPLVEDARFLHRILTSSERAILSTQNPSRKIQWLAGRFCAKEAIAKALGVGIGAEFSFQDVSILTTDRQAPHCVWAEGALTRWGALTTHLSISHSDHQIIALAVLESSSSQIFQ